MWCWEGEKMDQQGRNMFLAVVQVCFRANSEAGGILFDDVQYERTFENGCEGLERN